MKWVSGKARQQQQHHPLTFQGVFARDQIHLAHDSHKYPLCFIANTDRARDEGEHWVAFLFHSPTHYDFFDSFALTPVSYDFLLTSSARCVNKLTTRIQSLDSNVCGQHCIYFLTQCILNPSSTSSTSLFNAAIQSYSKHDTYFNDKMVTCFVCCNFKYLTSPSPQSNFTQSCKCKCECMRINNE